MRPAHSRWTAPTWEQGSWGSQQPSWCKFYQGTPLFSSAAVELFCSPACRQPMRAHFLDVCKLPADGRWGRRGDTTSLCTVSFLGSAVCDCTTVTALFLITVPDSESAGKRAWQACGCTAQGSVIGTGRTQAATQGIACMRQRAKPPSLCRGCCSNLTGLDIKAPLPIELGWLTAATSIDLGNNR